MFNMRRIKWALRKIQLPVAGSGLVLDVGSGGKPYPRSDVLLDRLTGAEHRCGVPMMIDRPTVFGDAKKCHLKIKRLILLWHRIFLNTWQIRRVFLMSFSESGRLAI